MKLRHIRTEEFGNIIYSTFLSNNGKEIIFRRHMVDLGIECACSPRKVAYTRVRIKRLREYSKRQFCNWNERATYKAIEVTDVEDME